MSAKDCLTCLHVACAYGRLDIASLLIDAGGDAIRGRQRELGSINRHTEVQCRKSVAYFGLSRPDSRAV